MEMEMGTGRCDLGVWCVWGGGSFVYCGGVSFPATPPLHVGVVHVVVFWCEGYGVWSVEISIYIEYRSFFLELELDYWIIGVS